MSTSMTSTSQIEFSVLAAKELEELKLQPAQWFSTQAELRYHKQSDFSCYVDELLGIALEAAKDCGDMKIEALVLSIKYITSNWQDELNTLAGHHEPVIKKLHAAESIVLGDAA